MEETYQTRSSEPSEPRVMPRWSKARLPNCSSILAISALSCRLRRRHGFRAGLSACLASTSERGFSQWPCVPLSGSSRFDRR